MLALLLRAAPTGLLQLSPHLLARANHYFSPAHAQLLLWAFAQASR